MLPKRKFIKKQYTAPQTTISSQPLVLSSQNLLQQLQSTNQKIKSDAISAIANIHTLTPQLQQQLYSTTSLMQIIKILKCGQPALIQTTLFAINNLCMIQTQIQGRNIKSIVHSLFQVGLAQALLQVNSNDNNLIKPILVLMGNIADYIPDKYRYLLTGLQNTLVSNSQKYLQKQLYFDLVLEFFIKSSYILPSNSFTPQSLTPQQIIFVKILKSIAQMDKMYKNRAMASRILINMTCGNAKQCVDIFCNNFQQFIKDIDLQKQYQINYQQIKKQMGMQLEEDIQYNQGEQQQIEQKQENMMEQQKPNNYKNKNNKKQQNNNKNKSKNKQLQPQTPYTFFIDALQGIQVMLQFTVQQLQDQNNFDDQQQQQQDQQDMNQEGNQNNQFINTFNKQLFLISIQISLNKVINCIEKYTNFSFIEGQNLIQLFLRLIFTLPLNKNQSNNNNISQQILINLTEQILINQFKFQIKYPHNIPQQVFIYNFKTCLQIILKYKKIINRNIYIQLPYLKYENIITNNNNNNNNNKIEDKIIKINNKWKQCWINLLQIYSLFYNPQKIINVTQNENKNIGGILKQLIVQIPQIQLQQWRGQTIDTVFDIYSNENFDTIFMQYGFVQILTQVLKVATGNNNVKNNKNNKKANKFINAILSDIQRFIAYKKKMIGF